MNPLIKEFLSGFIIQFHQNYDRPFIGKRIILHVLQYLSESMKKDQGLNESFLTGSSEALTEIPTSSYLSNLPIIDGANLYQSVLFTWLHPFLDHGSKKGVTIDSMPTLPHRLSTSTQHQRMMHNWQTTPKSSKQGWTIIKTLVKTFKRQIIAIIFLLLWVTILFMMTPFLTSLNIQYIQKHKDDIQYGVILFAFTIFVCMVFKISFAQLMYKFQFIGIQLCNCLNMMIYNKSLKYSTLANKKFSEAQIINYSQTDAERLTYSGFQLSAFFYGPIQIIFALLMMYFYVGISFLSGVAVVAVILTINYFMSKLINHYNQEVLKAKDQRMKVVQQMLDIIRFIKISTIQKFFFNKIQAKRQKQIGLYLKKGLLFVVMIFNFWITCPLLLSLTFITYVLLGNQLSSETAFTMIMLSNVLQYPIHSLPTAVSELIQIMVSIKRIEKFLLTEDINTSLVTYEHDSKYAVRIQNGNFFWGKEQIAKQQKQKQKQGESKQKIEKQENSKKNWKRQKKDAVSSQYIEEKDSQSLTNIHILKDINVSIQKGKFVMIIGDIGSGKSSLLLSILNEMIHNEQSKVFVSGSIAYCPQKPWILSKTVKQNITFSLPYYQQKFNKVIYHSSFEQDLKILPKGTETEIGQKGINISGGQKARLSLARALYSDSDIYLLDDILSAVDVHVGDFLMKETLKGVLRGKTILMPTHALRYIQQADQIIMMTKGKISQKGTYSEFSSNPEFQDLFLKEAEHKKQESKDKEQNEEQIQAEIAMINQVFKHKSQSYSQEKEIIHDASNTNEAIIEQLILPQDQQKGEININILKQFIKNCGGYLKFVVPVIASMSMWIICKTLASVFLQKGCQDPSGNNKQLYLFVGFVMLGNIFVLVRSIIMIISSTKQGKIVHDKMMKSLLYTSLSNFFNRVPIGRIVNRLTKDLREIDQDILDSICWVIIAFFEMLSTLVICLYAASVFAIIPMIIVGFISVRVRKYYMKTQRQMVRYQKSTNSPIVSGFMSSINGLSSIRAYKMQNVFLQSQMQTTDCNKRVRLSKSGLENWFCNVLGFLSYLINMPCIGYCMLSNNTNPALMGLLMVYALSLSDCMISLTLASANFESKLVSLERIYTFMNIEPEQDYKQYCQNWDSEQQGAKQSFDKGALQFNATSARYRKDLPDVLKGITCQIQPGQKVGIVGRTGAGKSTIINTLLKITQVSSGNVKIDGRNLNEYNLRDLRHSITMIDQEPTLIKSTFKENLDMANQYTNEDLQNILRECNLLEIINEKGGLDATVSNNSLSAGQKQLLCICRAFLKRSKIVLIDEATANIDVKNDAIIQRVIADKFKESTVLTIAHRLSTLKNSDKIMVLEKGSLIEFGDPDQLQNRSNGFYAQMIKKNQAELLS